MTPLEEELRALIAAEGPMTLERFMGLALAHPKHGYYATHDPIGAAGDFITAPEISQMFGELIGLWAAEVWMVMGLPSAITLAELGPGRGTLMADALRAAQVSPEFRAAINVELVEISGTLRARQQINVQVRRILRMRLRHGVIRVVIPRVNHLRPGPFFGIARWHRELGA